MWTVNQEAETSQQKKVDSGQVMLMLQRKQNGKKINNQQWSQCNAIYISFLGDNYMF